MSVSQTSVLKLYNTVIEDVIAGVRDSFLDEGVDEQVLMELKQIWEAKLMASKAVDRVPDPPEPQPPQLPTHKGGSNRGNAHSSQGSSTAGSSKSQSQQQQQQQQKQQQQSMAQQTQHQPQSHQQPQSQPQVQSQQQQQIRPPVLQSTQASAPPPPPQPQPQSQPIQQQQQQQQQQQHVNMPIPQAQTPVTLFERQIPIQITLPGNAAINEKPKVLSIQVPASAVHGNQLGAILSGQVITAAMGFPPDVASRMLQQHVDKTFQGQAAMNINQPIQVIRSGNIAQMDGQFVDTSDEEEDEEDDDNDDDDDIDDDNNEEDNDDSGAREEEPLNSEDDVTDEDPTDLFETENVVVCQYDKITRSRNKWKFYLKDGIMNLEGKDFVFQKASGDAEW